MVNMLGILGVVGILFPIINLVIAVVKDYKYNGDWWLWFDYFRLNTIFAAVGALCILLWGVINYEFMGITGIACLVSIFISCSLIATSEIIPNEYHERDDLTAGLLLLGAAIIPLAVGLFIIWSVLAIAS